MIDITELYDEEISKRALENPIYIPKFIGIGRLGKCARQTILMFDPKVERREYSKEKIEGEQRMFRIAKKLEKDYANLLFKKGKMFAYNAWVTEWLPKGCAGQFDFLLRAKGQWDLIEFKASHPNIMNFAQTLPKPMHVKQAKGYVYALSQMGIICDNYCVMYVAQGGTSRPKEFWRKIDGKEHLKKICEEIKAELFYLLRCRKTYKETGELPPVTGRVMVLKNAPKPKDKKKDYDPKEIKLEASWECNEDYCEFSGISCEPDKGNNKIASISKDGIIKVRKGYEDLSQEIEQFVKTQTEV